MIPSGTKVKIIQINKASVWYKDRKRLIGKIGVVIHEGLGYWKHNKCHYGWIKLDDGKYCFHQVRVKILKEEA